MLLVGCTERHFQDDDDIRAPVRSRCVLGRSGREDLPARRAAERARHYQHARIGPIDDAPVIHRVSVT